MLPTHGRYEFSAIIGRAELADAVTHESIANSFPLQPYRVRNFDAQALPTGACRGLGGATAQDEAIAGLVPVWSSYGSAKGTRARIPPSAAPSTPTSEPPVVVRSRLRLKYLPMDCAGRR